MLGIIRPTVDPQKMQTAAQVAKTLAIQIAVGVLVTATVGIISGAIVSRVEPYTNKTPSPSE